MAYTIEVNGEKRTVDVDGDMPLLWVLRDELDLKGSKFGCGVGLCGACTVHLDGEAVRSCIDAGLERRQRRRHDDRRDRRHDRSASGCRRPGSSSTSPQCGYCQAGQIMSATALLAKTPHPTDQDIDEAMSGNVCRCCTYTRIRAAIKKAARPAHRRRRERS